MFQICLASCWLAIAFGRLIGTNWKQATFVGLSKKENETGSPAPTKPSRLEIVCVIARSDAAAISFAVGRQTVSGGAAGNTREGGDLTA